MPQKRSSNSLVVWNIVCSPIAKGGSGVRKIGSLNQDTHLWHWAIASKNGVVGDQNQVEGLKGVAFGIVSEQVGKTSSM